MDKLEDRYLGCLLGLAAGDAVGTTVEFRPRGTFEPVVNMVGGGPFQLNAGEWTDDTSMALCLAHSLLACNGFNASDQMDRYCDWMDNGTLSSNGVCFDIGNTVRAALLRFQETGDPFSGSTNPLHAGNGCIMRLAPVPMFYRKSVAQTILYSGESARTTHAAAECIDASRLFGVLLLRALQGASKSGILEQSVYRPVTLKIQQIAGGAFRGRADSEIKGTGYVVDSLEAALYCFYKTGSFEAAILMAANLGDDADTTAAVCGQVAGAFYGRTGIPQGWLDKLVLRDEIETLALKLFRQSFTA